MPLKIELNKHRCASIAWATLFFARGVFSAIWETSFLPTSQTVVGQFSTISDNRTRERYYPDCGHSKTEKNYCNLHYDTNKQRRNIEGKTKLLRVFHAVIWWGRLAPSRSLHLSTRNGHYEYKIRLVTAAAARKSLSALYIGHGRQTTAFRNCVGTIYGQY